MKRHALEGLTASDRNREVYVLSIALLKISTDCGNSYYHEHVPEENGYHSL